MAAQTLNAEDITQSVVEQIVQRLNIKPGAFVKSIVGELTKGFIDKKIEIKATTTPFALPNIFSRTAKDKINQQAEKSESDKLENIEKPKPILFDGFTTDGLKSFSTEMPLIIKDSMKAVVKDLIEQLEKMLIKLAKMQNNQKDGGGFKFPGLGIITGALGVLSTLGGALTLLYGLQTEGPFKGLAKLVGKGMLEIGKDLTKPIQKFVSIMTKDLLEIPIKMLKSVGKNIGGLFKEAGAVASKIGLGKLTGFIPKFFDGFLKILKKIPLFGSLVSIGFAFQRLRSGDYVGGGIETLSALTGLLYLAGPPGAAIAFPLSLALDALNAFLDIKAGGATGKQNGAKLDILKDMGSWIATNVVKLPVIGPAIKAFQYLANREWKKGLKQLAFIVPVIDGIAAFLGDEDASDAAKAVAGYVQGVNWSEIGTWIAETFRDVPIIGPLIKAIEHFKGKEYLKGLKQLAYINPAFEMIGSLLGDAETGSLSKGLISWSHDLGMDLSEWIVKSLSDMVSLDGIKDSVKGAWNSLFGGDKPKEVKQTKDAKIDPNGGLIVSSPTEGALYQLSKNDGIVAGPMNSGKSENILESIANNTKTTNENMSTLISGFASLTRALEKMGMAIIEKPSASPVVVNSKGSEQPRATTTQLAKQGNPIISNFRNTIEVLRQRPA